MVGLDDGAVAQPAGVGMGRIERVRIEREDALRRVTRGVYGPGDLARLAGAEQARPARDDRATLLVPRRLQRGRRIEGAVRPNGDAVEAHVPEGEPAVGGHLDRQERPASRPGVAANLEDVGEVRVKLELDVAVELSLIHI